MYYVLIIGNNINLNNYDFQNKYVIGIDKGCMYALKNNIQLDYAVGDFDSLDKDTFNILSKTTKLKILPREKDDTDTAYAIKLCQNASNIDILGGIQGRRIEHFIANILLLKKNKNIRIIDDYSLIFTIDNDYKLNKSLYKYVSFYSLSDETIISLMGFKYNLDNYNLKVFDPLATSNEIVECGYIKIIKGKVLVILTKDDKL